MIKQALRSGLDRTGLVAQAYDVRAHARYATDRTTRRENDEFRAAGAPDGLPLPSPSLVYLVAGHFHVEWYYSSGVAHAALLKELLAANGVRLEDVHSLLDFGCGCGRVIRHWRDEPVESVHGSDYNQRLVQWCRGALPFAEFRTNGFEPPLDYAGGEFDFVYAISVFTHLTESLQHAWMRELERVLAPNGLLAFTTKGRSRLGSLSAAEVERFNRGELVVQEGRYDGRNLCAAYHPEEYVRERLAGRLDVVDARPASGGDQSQDVFLLRKPG